MDAIDLNCDMGESFGAWTMGSDAEMLKIVSSANVACGFHGGDPLVMFETVSRAKENGVGIGAHPSFFDVWGFGRRQIQGETPEDIEKMVVYQIGALQGVARAVGHRVGHVKAHGTLANLAAVDRRPRCRSARAIAGDRPRPDLCRDGRHRAASAPRVSWACDGARDLCRPRL